MIDPLSVAGLSLAVIDGLIKLTERTAELVSDINAFEDDAKTMQSLIVDETIRTRLLRHLLFSECPIYGNQTLFEQFEGDIQKQVELLLGELKSILQEGTDILERQYGDSSRTSSLSTSTKPSLTSTLSNLSLATTLTATSQTDKSPTTSLRRSFPALLKWSLRDKKRVETIVKAFTDRNDRLHEKIKLWCLASQLGVRTDHLQHLQEDETSRRLGFDKDAALKLTQWGAQHLQTSLELTDPAWDRHIKPIEHAKGTFTTFVKDGVVYVQENHSYTTRGTPSPGPAQHTLDALTKKRVESLANLLHQPKEVVFRILPCVGWRYQPASQSIAFMFKVQPKPAGSPVSLVRLLQEPDRRPELGDKFRLATELARCISQLHMVKWVHESFRSENVLLFPGERFDESDSRKPVLYTEPWVLGFMYSRPEPFFSAGIADFDPQRDIYRHPDRQGQPTEMFRKIHDIYALGVVLLEIGLWEPAIQLDRSLFAHARDSKAVQEQLMKHTRKRLESRVGRKYRDVVLKCLSGQFGVSDDSREELMLQQAFRSQVVDVLEHMANAL